MLSFFCFFYCQLMASTFASPSYVAFDFDSAAVPLVSENVAPLYIDKSENPGVLRAVHNLKADIERVTGKKPDIINETVDRDAIVIIGTIGVSPLIKELSERKMIDVSTIHDRQEAYLVTTVENYSENIKKALVIAGSDKRGTIYGIYDLSSRIGVSPWYWWADVPVKKHDEIYVIPVNYYDYPKVRYRGIFLNDEAPALTGWANENFGGFKHGFYEKVFELILRLKGNFLWPAMWGSAFFDDDTLNGMLANEYGVVIGTSHHEPLLRAHDEWRRYGSGAWNYETNPEKLSEFWRNSIKERKDFETVITVGMRGDGDEAMTEGTAIALLERIIKDQRQILKEETGKDPDEIPQAWALYKEVQDYYDEGMQVPEDITLLMCDDNWGNVRRLPKPGTAERSGGYGMYYHYDFVGGPVSYRWLNVNPIARTWEQMNLTYEHGVDNIWIVNVGDLKPMEFPIDFFLDHAWDPERLTADVLPEYTQKWAEEQFGPKYASEIADLLTSYTRYNYRRTPEMLKPETYSLVNFREAETVVRDYNQLLTDAREIGSKLPEEYKDAYYQLVTHQIEACANLNEMYYTTAKNQLYAKQERSATNKMAEKVQKLFENDAAISKYYHEQLSDGKWNHFMSQTHIGYTSWNNPDVDKMPEVKKIKLSGDPEMGLMVEGSANWFPDIKTNFSLPEFDNFNKQEYYIELFNRGEGEYKYTITTKDPWVLISSKQGKISDEDRIWISIDWTKVPAGENTSSIKIDEGKMRVEVAVKAINHAIPAPSFKGFVEANGYVSMEAEHYTGITEMEGIKWQIIPGFGRNVSGVTPLPSTHAPVTPAPSTPRLDYDLWLYNSGDVEVDVYIAPSLNIYNDEGMKYGISFDRQQPEIISIHKGDTIADWKYPAWWNNSVTDNIRVITTNLTVSEPGKHTLNFWMVTPGVVLEKIVVRTKQVGQSYLGPPESHRVE